jgi:hypothetical protein
VQLSQRRQRSGLGWPKYDRIDCQRHERVSRKRVIIAARVMSAPPW